MKENDVFRAQDEFEYADFGITFGCDFMSEMEFRIRGSIDLLLNDRVGTMILSGGATGDSETTEAEQMSTMAFKAGVNPDRLLLESESRTTQQNVLCCRRMLDQRVGFSKEFSMVLVTSDWHMSRVWMIAKRHFPSTVKLVCAPQTTTCNQDEWSQTIQCACLVKSELNRVRHAFESGYPDPRV